VLTPRVPLLAWVGCSRCACRRAKVVLFAGRGNRRALATLADEVLAAALGFIEGRLQQVRQQALQSTAEFAAGSGVDAGRTSNAGVNAQLASARAEIDAIRPALNAADPRTAATHVAAAIVAVRSARNAVDAGDPAVPPLERHKPFWWLSGRTVSHGTVTSCCTPCATPWNWRASAAFRSNDCRGPAASCRRCTSRTGRFRASRSFAGSDSTSARRRGLLHESRGRSLGARAEYAQHLRRNPPSELDPGWSGNRSPTTRRRVWRRAFTIRCGCWAGSGKRASSKAPMLALQ
jgi:hypothetical protein